MDGLKDYRDTFVTEALICTYLNGHYKLMEDRRSIYKPPNWIMCFFREDYYKYYRSFTKCGIFALDQAEMDSILSDSTTAFYNFKKNKIVTLNVEPGFFELKGKAYKKIRQFRNRYSRFDNLRVYEKPQKWEDIHTFLHNWRNSGSNPYYKYIIGIDKNFFKKYAFDENRKLINRFFYLGNDLVGYSVIEKIRDNLYNHLIRKAVKTFSHLSLFIDYYVYKELSDSIGKPFIMNLGDSGGQEKLIREKSENFPIYKILDCLDLSIAVTDDATEKNSVTIGVKIHLP